MLHNYESMMNGFLEEIIPAFCENLSEEDSTFLSSLFEEKMKSDYTEIFKEAVTIQNIETNNVVSLFATKEKDYWQKLSAEGKKMVLIYDECYENLLSLSLNIFKKAQTKLDEDLEYVGSDESYKELLDQLRINYKGVQDFNEKRGRLLYLEAIQDLDYYFGKTDKLSLRLSRTN